jgi:predicted DNA-binding transcriptional regulator AlpA
MGILLALRTNGSTPSSSRTSYAPPIPNRDPPTEPAPTPFQAMMLKMFEDHLQVQRSIAESLQRLADHLAPQPRDIVGTPYVAQQLGCSTAWITDLIKQGEIPSSCIVEGTGNGKPWKFRRRQIEEWIKNR